MTQAQHKAFSEACTRFGDELAKIFGTEAPKMDQEQDVVAMRMEVPPEVLEGIPTEDDIHDAVRCYLNANKCVKNMPSQGWEILEYKEKDGAGLIDASLLSTSHIPQCDIWKVRRLSDNTVWTVGDKVANDTGGHGNITAFHISANNRIRVDADCFLLSRDLEQLRMPEKKPLFTTADGVGISEGKVVWELYRNQVYPVIFTSDRKEASTLYSTQEAAEKAYDAWMESQPVLSFKDVSEWDNSPDGWDKLREIVKQKIANR